MKHLKRILSVLLLISLIPLLPLTVGADEESGSATTPQTVYVSAEGNDETATVGDRTKPYADFLTAYGELTATGGTVVLLNDVTVDMSAKDKIGDADRIYLPKSEHPISVCGIYQTESHTYSALHLVGGDAGVCFELEGDVTFYDMTFRMGYAQNLFFAANGYKITFGFNITNETASGKYANIMGGAQNANGGISQNSKSGPTITVYSGVWNGVYAASFDGTAINGEATVNIYGGSFQSVTSCRNKAASKNALKHKVHFRYYAGSPEVIKAFGKEATLYLYNGMTIAADKTDISEENIINVATAPLPAPEYALNFYGTQVTALKEGKYSVRFVGTLNSLDYSAVGLLIRTENAEYGGCCEKVYTSILGDFKRYTAEQLGGNYIFTWTIQNIPESAGSVTFTVTPFLATGDTVWYGQVSTVTYQTGILQ